MANRPGRPALLGRARVVYVLENVTEREEHDSAKMIGVFSSEATALAAQDKLVKVEGFRNHPDGFNIDAYDVDKLHWAEGFIDD